MDNQFGCAGCSKDHAGAAFVYMCKRVIGGIVQHFLGDNEAKKLAGICLLNCVGRDPKAHWIKGDTAEKGSSFAVGFIGCSRVGIVVVVNQPIFGRHILNLVATCYDVIPEATCLKRSRKESAHTDNGDIWRNDGRQRGFFLGF